MTKKEFVLGISIIVFCVTFWTMFGDPIIESTKEIKIKEIYYVESTTDESGNVEVTVKWIG